jgi:hypothetical protein
VNDDLYQHPVEKWSREKCAKIVKRYTKDGMGTRDHLPGFLKQNFGIETYNGGCTREGKWYRGEYFPTPTVPKEYEIIYVSTWWHRLVLRDA